MLGPEYHVKLEFVKDGATPASGKKIGKHLVTNTLDKCRVSIDNTYVFLQTRFQKNWKI